MIIPISQDTNKFYISIDGGEPQVVKKLIYNDSQVQNVVVWADYYSQYFTIENKANTSTHIVIEAGSGVNTFTHFDYSYDLVSWTVTQPPSGGYKMTIDIYLTNNGDKVYLRAEGTTLHGVTIKNGSDTPYNWVEVYGNIMSLLYGDNFEGQSTLPGSNCFDEVFNTLNIRSAKNLKLPATTLTPYCYRYMFWSNSILIEAPELPATNLADHCYYGMFKGCLGLTSAPNLPATTLAARCYTGMFQGCSNLVDAPVLPATTLAAGCYRLMFDNCTSLVNAPVLPATTLEDQCYRCMFSRCTSLVNAPELPALTLVAQCYQGMFSNSTSVSNIVCLATDISAYNCLEGASASLGDGFNSNGWVDGVSSSGTFYKDSTMSSWPSGAKGIPANWTTVNYN
jgi:hypothetical protein